MGEAELVLHKHRLIIHSVLFFYGEAANDILSAQIAKDIADHWNGPRGKVTVKNTVCDVVFDIAGLYAEALTPQIVYENTDPRNNYFRVEVFAAGNISSVDGIGSNTGYFKLDNLQNNSTTAAHEYGHSIGLDHPSILDIRGKGVPGIMYPRGTIVDPMYQYDPHAEPLQPGGTMNPFTRKVTQEDIDKLRLHRLRYTPDGFATVGGFSSEWHEKHLMI